MNAQKRAVIVHCWSGCPEYCWYQSTKRELEAMGFEVTVPAMPETDAPKLGLWLPKLREVIGTPDENLYLIGHSIGTVTIMRYLETLGEYEKVGGVVLVAGYTEKLPGYPEIDNFFETALDFEKIKPHARHFAAIQSDNDPYVPLRFGDILARELGAVLRVKHAMGHFSCAADKEAAVLRAPVTQLPDVAEIIGRWAT